MSTVEAILAWIRADRDAEGLDPIELTTESALIDGGLLDSMKLIELVQWIEDTYAVTIGVESMTPAVFGTPAALAARIDALRAANAPGG